MTAALSASPLLGAPLRHPKLLLLFENNREVPRFSHLKLHASFGVLRLRRMNDEPNGTDECYAYSRIRPFILHPSSHPELLKSILRSELYA